MNCFVGSFMTSSVVNFQSMRATVANVWHPVEGITIMDLLEGRFLFQLYHKVDAGHLEAGAPWNFNSHLLVLHHLRERENPKEVPLNTVVF